MPHLCVHEFKAAYGKNKHNNINIKIDAHQQRSSPSFISNLVHSLIGLLSFNTPSSTRTSSPSSVSTLKSKKRTAADGAQTLSEEMENLHERSGSCELPAGDIKLNNFNGGRRTSTGSSATQSDGVSVVETFTEENETTINFGQTFNSF